MNVYVVMTRVYEDQGPALIFSTEQKARDYIATFGRYVKWSLEIHTVDEPKTQAVYLGDEQNPTLTPSPVT